jgi:heme/copper-type cytochrome/quinol oxidase subunit 3
MDHQPESETENPKRKNIFTLMIKKLFLLVLSVINCLVLWAQDTTKEVAMADAMRQNGKIYVVVAVIVTIFTGIVLYLIRLDRKISKLEKNNF